MTGVETAAIVSAVIGGAQAYASHKTQKKQAKRQQEAAAIAQAAEEAEAAAEIEEIELEQAQEEAEQQRLLRSQVATQRANMAAAGVSGYGGSSDAVVKGLTDATEEEIETNRALDTARINTIKSNLAASTQTSLLGLANNEDSDTLDLFDDATNVLDDDDLINGITNSIL